MYNSVTFSTFTMLCNHHHYLVPEHLHHPKRKAHTHYAVASLSSLLQPVTVDLPILNVSYKCNRTICGLLCLTAFTYHDVFAVHLIASDSCTSFFFLGEWHSIVWICRVLLVHWSADGHLDCLYLLLSWIMLQWTFAYECLFERNSVLITLYLWPVNRPAQGKAQ